MPQRSLQIHGCIKANPVHFYGRGMLSIPPSIEQRFVCGLLFQIADIERASLCFMHFARAVSRCATVSPQKTTVDKRYAKISTFCTTSAGGGVFSKVPFAICAFSAASGVQSLLARRIIYMSVIHMSEAAAPQAMNRTG
jgi:hypothetical protein